MIQNFIPIVLCAGFGTRLKPITNVIPKVICPIIDKPLAFFSIEKFFKYGFEYVYCNTHYMPDLVENELKACASHFGYNPERIIFFKEDKILGSGGGALNVVQNLYQENESNKEKDVIIASGDVVADFPLDLMISVWKNRTEDELALMLSLRLTEDRDDILCVSKNGKNVLGFGKEFPCENKSLSIDKRLFSNHQIISAELFKDQKLSFISSVDLFYRKILTQHRKSIIHLAYPESVHWFNVGDIWEYRKCIQYFCEKKNLSYPTESKMHYCNNENIEMLSEIIKLQNLE